MKSNLIKSLLFAAIVSCLYSCSKDDKIVNPGNEKELTIDGFITDDQGLYIQNVSIEFANATTTTDINGYFQIPLTKYSGEVYIKASKQGYFTGSRTLFLEKSKSAHVRISLLQKSFSKFFNTANNAIVDNGKVKLEFPANAIVNESGQVYNGKVNVAIQYLDPSDFSIRNIMPGDLVGLNTNGEMQQLGSYGMAAIELQSNTGAPLQIKENEEVMLKIEIPQSLRANSPSTIPLWYFDEVTGLWKEQGTATKNGNVYEGKVKHFSFWNCDISWPLVHLQGRIIDYSNKGISNSNVKLTIVRTGMSAYDRTNGEGFFEGKVPKNEALKLELIDDCSNVIFSKNIGPFNSDIDLGEIQILNNNSPYLVSIEGSVVDCNNQGFSNALVLIKSGSFSYSLQSNSDGRYSGSLTFCDFTQLSITAIDIKTLKQSQTVLYSLPGPIQASTLQICQDTVFADEYISCLMSDGDKEIFLSELYIDLGTQSHTIVSYWDTSRLSIFDIMLNALPELQTKIKIDYMDLLHKDIISQRDAIYSGFSNGIDDVGYVQYSKIASKVGEYYEGSFQAINLNKEDFNTGEVLGTNLTMNGSFRIKRK